MKAGIAVYNILNDDVALTALVGAKVFPTVIAQDTTYPAVSFQIVGTRPADDKDGPSAVDEISVQVDSYSGKYSEVTDMAAAVRSALDRYPHEAKNGITIDGIQFLSADASYVDGLDLHRISQDFIIRVKE